MFVYFSSSSIGHVIGYATNGFRSCDLCLNQHEHRRPTHIEPAGEDLDLIGWNGDTFDPQAVFGDAESG